MYKGIIFDLDGTLLDTTEGVVNAVERTLFQLELIKPDNLNLEQFVGPPMQDSFQRYFGMDKEEALKAANIFRDNYKKKSLFMAKVYDDVFNLLELLKNENYKIAIATNKSHENAIEILKQFRILEYCDYAAGSDLDGKLKKSDIINICIEQLKFRSDELLYIGDSSYDLKGAKQSGLDFLGVTYGFGFGKTESIDNDECIAVCDSVMEIIDFLKLS